MIICKTCTKETSVAIRGEFLCFACYDAAAKAKPVVTHAPKIGSPGIKYETLPNL